MAANSLLVRGFELDTPTTIAHDWVTGSTAVTCPAEGPRGGNCVKFAADGNCTIAKAFRTPSANVTLGFRAKFPSGASGYIASMSSPDGRALALIQVTGGTIRIQTELAGTWYGIQSILPDTWNYFEVPFKVHASTGWTGVYRGGSQSLETTALTGNTKGFSTIGTLSRVTFGGINVQWRLADVYVIDSSLLADKWNSVRVSAYLPNAAGGSATLNSQNGGTNYTNVDDATFDGADYVYGQTGRDVYKFPSLGFTPATGGMRSVWLRQTALVTDATPRVLEAATYNEDSGLYQVSSNSASPELNWQSFDFPFDTDPESGDPWSATIYGKTQFGPKVT